MIIYVFEVVFVAILFTIIDGIISGLTGRRTGAAHRPLAQQHLNRIPIPSEAIFLSV